MHIHNYYYTCIYMHREGNIIPDDNYLLLMVLLLEVLTFQYCFYMLLNGAVVSVQFPVDSSLVIITIYLVWLIYAWE